VSDKPSNVVSLPGAPANVAGKQPPNENLIAALEDVLAMAKDGRLQSFIGAGVTQDDMRMTVWSDYHNDIYQMLGSLAWLQAEYIKKHADE
jgi:hypothetical protein